MLERVLGLSSRSVSAGRDQNCQVAGDASALERYYRSKVSRPAWFALLVLGTAAVLVALRGAVVYDFERHLVVSGFDASHWTWLLVVAGGVLAMFGLVARRSVLSTAAIVNVVAAACVTLAIVGTVHATPKRIDAEREAIDCSNQNIGIGCRAHQLLDRLEPAPPAAAPSRALLILALSAYALFSVAAIRRARSLQP